MKAFALSTLLFTSISLHAASAVSYPYDWEADRKPYVLTDAERSASELILKEHIEYAYVMENDQFLMYSVMHRIVRVNNNEAIQRHNRIKLSLDETYELIELKARAIAANGKIINFDKGNIKEIKDEETGKTYRIFAMEGVEVGSEVEYFFVRKMSPYVFARNYFQKDVPVKEATFTLKSPKNLEWEFRSYHGLPEIEATKGADEQNIYTLVARDVPPIEEEDFSASEALNQRLEYKLAYNKARSFAKMYTWDIAGKQFYARIFSTTKDDDKAIEKFVKTLRDDPSRDLQERIRNIERQVKTSVHLNEDGNDPSLSDLSSITKYKIASKQGITRLFAATFSALNIPIHLVLTCDRSERRFDENFDSWNFLDDYLLYFPDANTFLSPYNQLTYSPIVNPGFTGHKGLFIEPIQLGTLKSALASTKDIPAAPWEHNLNNLDIAIRFSEDGTANEVSMKRIYKGLSASYYAPYYDILSNEQRKSMIDEMVSPTAPGLQITKWSGQPVFDGPIDEFIVDVDFTTPHFLERAGPRILFKLGLVIGPQAELYQNEKRTLPVENYSNRGYERTIVVTIPDGYTIKNPDDLNLNVVFRQEDATPFSFVSSYKLEGQKLTVTVNEYYKELFVPLERFDDFRKVVNAAADFNKVTLVLEKKK